MPRWKGRTTVAKKQLKLFASKSTVDVTAVEESMSKYINNFAQFETLMDEQDDLDPQGEYHSLTGRFAIESDYLEVLQEAEVVKGVCLSLPIRRTSEASERSYASSSTSSGSIKGKLPDPKLPTFWGDVTQYMSFKINFNSVVAKHRELNKSDMLNYLISGLKGEAVRKVQMLSISDENYNRAWQILDKAYSDTRVIVSRHLHQLLKMPQQEKEVVEGLAKLVDSTRQHMESGNGLNIVVGDQLIVALLEQKLAKVTTDAWDDKQERGVLPQLEDMLDFLTRRGSRLQTRNKEKIGIATESSTKSNHKHKREQSKIYAFNSTTGKSCQACDETFHALFKCNKFRDLSVEQRIKIAKQSNVCLNCLNKHKGECKYGGCRHCPEKHNSLLHSESMGERESLTAMKAQISSNQVMTTAIVNMVSQSNQSIPCRVLLDTGATANFITEELAVKLNLRKKACVIPIDTLSEMATYTKHVVTATITSRYNGFKKECTFLTVPRISSLTQNSLIPRESVRIPFNIHLADPEFYKPPPIDILLGTEATLSLLTVGQIDLSPPEGPDLFLHKTQLGWIHGGAIQKQQGSNKIQYHQANVDLDLQKFWKIEEISDKKVYSAGEQKAVEHFKHHHSRDSTGRYTVALSFKEKQNLLGNSYRMALKRFHSLERKFSKDPELFEQYSANIDKYLRLNYLTKVKNPADTKFYLPHHSVIKKDSIKTKVRVVYDGSAKTTTGVSLNESLMVGPTLQEDIFWLILHFRTHQYALTGDIEKMYLQFGIREEDRRYQRILWRDEGGEIAVYELNNVTFGLSSSPYQAVQCLQQLADDEAQHHPVAGTVMKNHMYVDDLLSGFDTIHEARQAREEISAMLARGGLNMKHWASNEPKLLEGLPQDAIHQKLQLDDGSTLKTLGVYWDAQSDSITYTVKPVSPEEKVTKRVIMSEVATIYDPLGLLGPVILTVKTIIQKLWKSNWSWDESVPNSIHTEWNAYCAELNQLNEI
ncbi:uncharacterized protein LOC107045475 [Diachasma alloeum]|uniref:uncharacterized protein LOC107045475 n=1 Tax=Diachasma alloeum TaxID=454923 RepID=UPI0007381080|nr:uncharacterized protein LOC107045475 [Diachasma alloeum]